MAREDERVSESVSVGASDGWVEEEDSWLLLLLLPFGNAVFVFVLHSVHAKYKQML